MARITVEDCLERVENRFALVHLTAKRSRQIQKGSVPLVRCRNKPIVTALREIADSQVSFRPASSESTTDQPTETTEVPS